MLHLLVVVCIVSLAGAQPEVDVEPEAAANPVFVHDDHDRSDHRRIHDDHLHRQNRVEPLLSSTQRLKSSPCSRNKKPFIEDNRINPHLNGPWRIQGHVSDDILKKQYDIIEHTYSPDYYEPTLVLDYRYLKSGGRDYTRGPGGQILILPHGVRSGEHKEHKDFDSLLEFLRQKHQAVVEAQEQRHEDQQRRYHNHHGDVAGHEHWRGARRGPEVRVRNWS